MHSISVGVIGYGYMGRMHAAVYRALPQTELVAIADVQPSRLEGADLQGVGLYTDYHELLRREDIDAVSICTSDRAHLAPAVAAARAGKHILLEKPIALDLGEARQIVAEAKAANVKLQIGFLLRFDPRYAGVKDLLDQGRLGQVVHIHARRNSPKSEGPARYQGSTPLVFHVAIHDLDLVLWYLGRPAESVYAQTTSIALRGGGMDDSMFAILRFRDGVLVNLESSWALPEGSASKLDAYLEVLGTQGMARVECGHSGLEFCDAHATNFPDTVHWPQVGSGIVGDLREELARFAECVLHDQPPLVGGEDGVRALELAWAIQRSADTGQVVTL